MNSRAVYVVEKLEFDRRVYMTMGEGAVGEMRNQAAFAELTVYVGLDQVSTAVTLTEAEEASVIEIVKAAHRRALTGLVASIGLAPAGGVE